MYWVGIVRTVKYGIAIYSIVIKFVFKFYIANTEHYNSNLYLTVQISVQKNFPKL